MKASELSVNALLVSSAGGQLDYTDDETGEILFSVAVPPGRFYARPYLDLAPHGVRVEVSCGLVAILPKGGYSVQPYGDGSHDSGANPDFTPTSASRMEQQMRLTLNKMQATEKRLAARERSLAQIERIPVNSAPVVVPTPPVVAPVLEVQSAPVLSGEAVGE